jgi:type IV secretory pathway VirB6-like protein
VIEQPVPFYQRKSWLGYGLAVVLVSMIVRIGLARLPAVVTNDSLDYILASYAIAHHLDFFTASLRDWRMPGYPIFLAGLQSAVAFTSQNVALGQKMVGILGVVPSFIMAGQLNSRVVFILLPLFLGLNPAYLFDEHLVIAPRKAQNVGK